MDQVLTETTQFDIFDLPSEFCQRPHAVHDILRENDPLHVNKDGSYFVNRWADVFEIYQAPGMTSEKRAMYSDGFQTNWVRYSDRPGQNVITNNAAK